MPQFLYDRDGRGGVREESRLLVLYSYHWKGEFNTLLEKVTAGPMLQLL